MKNVNNNKKLDKVNTVISNVENRRQVSQISMSRSESDEKSFGDVFFSNINKEERVSVVADTPAERMMNRPRSGLN